MKKHMMALLAGLSMAALMFGGCASNEVVKTEDPAAATVKAEATKPVQKPYFKAEDSSAATQKQIAEAAPTSAKSAEDQAANAAASASTLETVYFDFDRSDLRQDARNVLAKNAEILLKSKRTVKIRIEGHTDERGSAEYNLALGERRAKAALQYLVTLGVQPERFSIVSYGKEKPAVQGNDEGAWAKNRRAEFMIDK
jgi:peptidoglycan-associated lipoprotein